MKNPASQREVVVAGQTKLPGTLTVPENAAGIVLFAHGSGSSRFSPRNRFVADKIHEANIGTLLMDLLNPEEERADARGGQIRFDISLLSDRLIGATDWLGRQSAIQSLPVGYFGASTGAAAALVAVSKRPQIIRAVVSRGGRPDLAGECLAAVRAPTLLIVGGADSAVIPLNERAFARLAATEKRIEIIPGAGHLFEEPGALDRVAELARDWFSHNFVSSPVGTRG